MPILWGPQQYSEVAGAAGNPNHVVNLRHRDAGQRVVEAWHEDLVGKLRIRRTDSDIVDNLHVRGWRLHKGRQIFMCDGRLMVAPGAHKFVYTSCGQYARSKIDRLYWLRYPSAYAHKRYQLIDV